MENISLSRLFVFLFFAALIAGSWFFATWWIGDGYWFPITEESEPSLRAAVVASGLMSVGPQYRQYGIVVLFTILIGIQLVPQNRTWTLLFLPFLNALLLTTSEINIVGISEKLWITLDGLALVILFLVLGQHRVKVKRLIAGTLAVSLGVNLVKSFEISSVGYFSHVFRAGEVQYLSSVVVEGFEQVVFRVIIPAMSISFSMQFFWLLLAVLLVRFKLQKHRVPNLQNP